MSTLSSTIKELGFPKAFPVQEKSFAAIQDKKDLIIQAPTGSGKTLSYLIPLALRLTTNPDKRCLIIAPSPELAMQIQKVCQELPEKLKISNSTFVGAGNIKRQRDKLKNNNDQIIIGTPGRILEFLDRKLLKITDFAQIVLDEADYILTDGLRQDLFKHFDKLEEKQQLILASATHGPESQEYIDNYMKDPELISGDSISSTIKHSFLLYPDSKKDIQLSRFLQKNRSNQVLIFCNLQKHIPHLLRVLANNRIKCDGLHGQSDKRHRQNCLNKFHKGELKVLVTTDTLARGIDFDNPMIVQYDPANKAETFIHRCGRTGRAGNIGRHVVMVSAKEGYRVPKLEKKFGITLKQDQSLGSEKAPSSQDKGGTTTREKSRRASNKGNAAPKKKEKARLTTREKARLAEKKSQREDPAKNGDSPVKKKKKVRHDKDKGKRGPRQA